MIFYSEILNHFKPNVKMSRTTSDICQLLAHSPFLYSWRLLLKQFCVYVVTFCYCKVLEKSYNSPLSTLIHSHFLVESVPFLFFLLLLLWMAIGFISFCLLLGFLVNCLCSYVCDLAIIFCSGTTEKILLNLCLIMIREYNLKFVLYFH